MNVLRDTLLAVGAVSATVFSSASSPSLDHMVVPAMKIITDLGSFGVILYVVIYIVRNYLPKREAQFAETIKELNAQILAERTRADARSDKMTEHAIQAADHSARIAEAVSRLADIMDRQTQGPKS